MVPSNRNPRSYINSVSSYNERGFNLKNTKSKQLFEKEMDVCLLSNCRSSWPTNNTQPRFKLSF